MAKNDNLNDYLADLYRGIVSKKPDASRNPQDFRSEIEAIKTDGSYKLYGKWKFKDELTAPSADIKQTINFTSNDWSHKEMAVVVYPPSVLVYYYAENDSISTEVYAPDRAPCWYINYQEVDFGNTPQSASEEYYEWVMANAEISEVPEWDGSFTKSVDLTGTTWEIPSGWKTSANQGKFNVDGSITVGGATSTFTTLLLGASFLNSTLEYQENYLSVLVDNGLQSLDNTNGFTLKITGGKDVNSPELASWLQSDGKLQQGA